MMMMMRERANWSRLNAVGMQVLLIIAADIYFCKGDYLMRTKNYDISSPIASILTDAYVVKRGTETDNIKVDGFIPAFLKELKDKGGIPKTSTLVRATGNEVARKLPNSSWTGIIGDVMSGAAKLGVGPILNNEEYSTLLPLSRPWVSVSLTFVVKKSSNVTFSLADTSNQFRFSIVKDSPEHLFIRRTSQARSSSVILELNNHLQAPGAKLVSTVHEGLKAVATEDRVVLILNTEDATYHVTHGYCDLKTAGVRIPWGDYVFVCRRGCLLLDDLNRVIDSMKTDGSLEQLRRKTIGVEGICSTATDLRAVSWYRMDLTALLGAAWMMIVL